MSVAQRTACSGCGAERPRAITDMRPRPPCEVCGATAVLFKLVLADELRTTDQVSTALTPGGQELDWRGRWDALLEEYGRLGLPVSEPMTRVAVLSARRRLLLFYVEAFHIRDALRAEAAGLGLDAPVLTQAIAADHRLALLEDLANLVKHAGEPRNPRSPAVPQFGKAVAVQDGSDPTWRLALPVEHQGRILDGYSFAGEAVAAWTGLLVETGLLERP